MCSAANFEFYQGEVMDVLGIYRMGLWSDTVQPYLAAIRGLSGRGSFARHLAGFLVGAGRHSYFLEYSTCILRTIIMATGACKIPGYR